MQGPVSTGILIITLMLAVGARNDKSQIYLPEKYIGCGPALNPIPKTALLIGSVGEVARGLYLII